jgi:hypothetical protein
MDDKLRQVRDDQAFWEQLAQEAENAKAALGEKWLRCKPNPRRRGRTELPVS